MDKVKYKDINDRDCTIDLNAQMVKYIVTEIDRHTAYRIKTNQAIDVTRSCIDFDGWKDFDSETVRKMRTYLILNDLGD